MEIIINNMQRKIKINEKKYINFVKKAIDLIELTLLEIEINFISLEKIKQYNDEYRGICKATDILSFNFGGFYSGDCGVLLIAPSYPLKHGVKNEDISHEIALLTIHGLLHLSGMDHPSGHVDDSPMGEKQKCILDEFSSSVKSSLVVVS